MCLFVSNTKRYEIVGIVEDRGSRVRLFWLFQTLLHVVYALILHALHVRETGKNVSAQSMILIATKR